jgi:hypothetical protein
VTSQTGGTAVHLAQEIAAFASGNDGYPVLRVMHGMAAGTIGHAFIVEGLAIATVGKA